MTQSTPIIGSNQSGLQYRTQDNDGKKALLNHHKGATAPSYAEAGIIWLDDTATPWKLKAYDGADWIVIGELNATANTFMPYIGSAGVRLLNHATDTGSANAYAVAPSPAVTAYATGQVVTLKPANNQTGACTVNVNSLGTKSIKTLAGADPASGMMTTNGIYILVYDGTNFVLLNPSLGSAAYLSAGTSANNVVQLDGSAKLPAVDGSQLTNIPSELVLLATATASSSSSLSFTSLITSAYDAYVFVFKDLVTSATSSINVKMSTDNGSTYAANISSQKWVVAIGGATGPTYTGVNNTTPALLSTSTNAATFHGEARLYNPLSAADYGFLYSQLSAWMHTQIHEARVQAQAHAVNAIQFLPSAGNFTSGKIEMYGVKNT